MLTHSKRFHDSSSFNTAPSVVVCAVESPANSIKQQLHAHKQTNNIKIIRQINKKSDKFCDHQGTSHLPLLLLPAEINLTLFTNCLPLSTIAIPLHGWLPISFNYSSSTQSMNQLYHVVRRPPRLVAHHRTTTGTTTNNHRHHHSQIGRRQSIKDQLYFSCGPIC